MRRKLKLLFKIFLVIIVTAICVALGFNTRYNSGIIISEFKSKQGNRNGVYARN